MGRYARSIIVYITAVLCSISVAYGAVAKTPFKAAAKVPVIDPRAVQDLKQMSDYLSSLQSFSVHVDAVVEGITPSGERLDADRSGDVWIERPNKLRVNVTSAHHNVQMYFDGSTFYIFSPTKNYYASWNAPGSIDDVLLVARRKYGLVMPGADFLAADPYAKLMARVKSAKFIADVPIGGVMTHQLAFRQPDVDWQIWIQANDTPVPRRVIINDKRASGEPKYMASFGDWNTTPVIDSSTFVFTPPAGAQKIAMRALPLVKRHVSPAKAPRKGGQK